jgi:hypothetical protein
MKVTYCLPAHPFYFKDAAYTQAEVAQAVATFQLLFKPGKLGEIPETFVFLTRPGKDVGPVFESKDMKSSDDETKERWVKNTMKFAWHQFEMHLNHLQEFLEAIKKLK